jgi:hypothetical protein
MTSLFSLDREMGYTRSDFFRLLPSALTDHDFSVNDNLISIHVGTGMVCITIGVERERRLTKVASFPVLPVRFEFIGLDQPSRTRFMKHFDSRFLKALA